MSRLAKNLEVPDVSLLDEKTRPFIEKLLAILQTQHRQIKDSIEQKEVANFGLAGVRWRILIVSANLVIQKLVSSTWTDVVSFAPDFSATMTSSAVDGLKIVRSGAGSMRLTLQDSAGKQTILTQELTSKDLYISVNGAEVLRILSDGGIKYPLIKSGATQAAAGALAGEIWKTNGHASLPNNVLMTGV